MPVVHYGSEDYQANLRRLRRTKLTFVVGQPFRLKIMARPVTGALRQQITDEVMFQLARLLPPQYRGVYADLNTASQDFLVFE
jgi:1-acyl-sn-glycerol-3-phosphate acyltransferase